MPRPAGAADTQPRAVPRACWGAPDCCRTLSLEHHGAVVVHNHPVLQVPPHSLGQHGALQVAALQRVKYSNTRLLLAELMAD